MARIIGVIFLGIGLLLLILGVQALGAWSEQVTDWFAGRAAERAIWFIIGGLLALAPGLFFTVQKIR